MTTAVNDNLPFEASVRTRSPQQSDKILAAAARLFASHRFHEARMEDVAALAEVGKGTVYRYFKDKEELYLALLDRSAEELHERLHTCLAPVDCPRGQLVALVAGLLAYFDEEPHVFDLIQHAEVMQRPGQEFPWQKVRNETMTLVKNVFHAGQRAGLFHVADPDLAALMLLGGLRAVIRFGPRPRTTSLAEQVVASFLDGYSTPCSRWTPPNGSSLPCAKPAPPQG